MLATTLTVTNDQNTKKEAKPSLEKMDHTKIFFDSSNSMDRNLVYIVSHHSCMLWNCVLSLTYLSMLNKNSSRKFQKSVADFSWACPARAIKLVKNPMIFISSSRCCLLKFCDFKYWNKLIYNQLMAANYS